jgi:mono/diheme cytochrome c family protein
MNRFMISHLLVAIGALVGLAAHAQDTSSGADVRAGRALSLQVCTTCHVVLPDQDMVPILRPPAPSFRSIANQRGTTEESVRRFLTETHTRLSRPGSMPSPGLTEDQVREVAAFLMSLRTPH